MRFGVSGPRIFGLRPWVSFPFNRGGSFQKRPGAPIEGSFVYVVRGDHNLAKIGVTTNPRARLAQLRTGSAFPIDYAFIGATPGSGYDIEQAAHSLLSHRRTNGEWFDVQPEVAISALMAAAGKLGQPVQVVDLATADRVLSVAAGSESPQSGGLIHWAVFVFGFAVLTFVIYRGAASVGLDGPPVMIGLGAGWLVMFAIFGAVAKVLGRL